LLSVIKRVVSAGFPVGFGSSVFDVLGPGPEIPFPALCDAMRGGAVFVCVGYDDKVRISSERGALRVRGPWGPEWGQAGSGWLPYRYLTEGLAGDFWTILRPDWLAEGELPAP
jgi:C1A family cysteine protease